MHGREIFAIIGLIGLFVILFDLYRRPMKNHTKKLIADTFTKMLISMPIGKITVTKLVEECGVNRQTFYYYFNDIYDLMEYSLMDKIEEFLANEEGGADWQGSVGRLIDFFTQNRKLVLHGYDAQNRTQYELFLQRNLFKTFFKFAENYSKYDRLPEGKAEFVSRMFSIMTTGLLIEWIEKGLPDRQVIVIDDFFTMLNGEFEHCLSKFLPK